MITSDPLSIYLNDHLAGATLGSELVRRACRQNEGSELGDFLEGLTREIQEDRAELEAIMSKLDVGEDRIKTAAAWTGEKIGRLKLNGRLLGYSPLSRMVELEGLLLAVQGKLALWRSLRELARDDSRLEASKLDGLIARAERQLEGIGAQHRRSVRDGLGSR